MDLLILKCYLINDNYITNILLMQILKLAKLWLLCLYIPFLISIGSNIYIETHQDLEETSFVYTFNKYSNNIIAFLWMHIHIPYKSVECV